MDEEKIKKVITDAFPALYQKYFRANFSSGRPLVPPHTHNGVDNLPVSGAGGKPGGNDTDIQFNDNGAFGGDDNLTFDKNTATLSVPNIADIGGAGMNIEPTGDLILKSIAQNVIIQALATNKDITIEAYQDVNFETTHRDINILSHNDVTIQAQNGTVVIQAQGTGSDMVLSADDAIVLEVAGPPRLIITTTGLFVRNSSAPTTPSGGGVLYSASGALHWLGSSGTDTVIAPA